MSSASCTGRRRSRSASPRNRRRDRSPRMSVRFSSRHAQLHSLRSWQVAREVDRHGAAARVLNHWYCLSVILDFCKLFLISHYLQPLAVAHEAAHWQAEPQCAEGAHFGNFRLFWRNSGHRLPCGALRARDTCAIARMYRLISDAFVCTESNQRHPARVCVPDIHKQR